MIKRVRNDEYHIEGRPKPSHHRSDSSYLIWILTVWMSLSEVVNLGSGYGQWREMGAVREWFIWPAGFGGLKGNPGRGCLLNFGHVHVFL